MDDVRIWMKVTYTKANQALLRGRFGATLEPDGMLVLPGGNVVEPRQYVARWGNGPIRAYANFDAAHSINGGNADLLDPSTGAVLMKRARSTYSDPKVRAACPHLNFAAHVNVARLSEEEGGAITGYAADIKIHCTSCKAPMRFVGIDFGHSSTEPRVSVDRTELRAPLEVEIVPELLDRTEDGRSGTA